MKTPVVALANMVALFLSAHGQAAAADTAPFYRGKQISLMVNYSAGGPTDIEARLLANHLAKHIPGNPDIIVRNMVGAGGMIGSNWLGQVAQPDGLTIGYLTALAGGAIQGSPALKIDPTSIPFLAGVEGVIVYYARSDLQGGLKQPEDIMRKSDFWIGGLTPDSSKDLLMRSELDLLGLHYKYISGYPGSAQVRLALEQNEVQFTSESLPAYRVSIEPSLINTGKATALWYDAADKYLKTGDPDAAGIKAPTFESFYRKVKGAPPQGKLWALRTVMAAVETRLLRTINVPPKTPPERIAILRKAISEVANDSDYRADALKALHYVPRFNVGPDAEKDYMKSVALDLPMKDFIRAYVAKGYAMEGK